jgi:hypothetical protein
VRAKSILTSDAKTGFRDSKVRRQKEVSINEEVRGEDRINSQFAESALSYVLIVIQANGQNWRIKVNSQQRDLITPVEPPLIRAAIVRN